MFYNEKYFLSNNFHYIEFTIVKIESEFESMYDFLFFFTPH